MFDQGSEEWLKWNFGSDEWKECVPPRPHGKWTGIGTRKISTAGLSAIAEVWNNTGE
jgi:hypothetical protein